LSKREIVLKDQQALLGGRLTLLVALYEYMAEDQKTVGADMKRIAEQIEALELALCVEEELSEQLLLPMVVT